MMEPVYAVLVIQLLLFIGLLATYRKDRREHMSTSSVLGDHEERLKTLEGRTTVSIDRVLTATIKNLVRAEFVGVNRRMNDAEATQKQMNSLLFDIAQKLGVTPQSPEIK